MAVPFSGSGSCPCRLWHIDPLTKRLIDKMESVDDKERRSVTFTTGHLSAYAIAF